MSFTPGFNPAPKTPPRFLEKAARKAAEVKAIKDCYRQVDARDGATCRLCKRNVGGKTMDTARVHHHLIFRSAGGEHTTANVLSICPFCDDLIHREGKLKVSGNADTLNSQGQFCGVRVERLVRDIWKIEGMR